jgi:CDP-glucose 4,6-dehydratase
VFLTGHTGFKGAYLVAMLKHLGHEVGGFSDQALGESLFTRAGLERQMDFDLRADICDFQAVAAAMSKFRPDFVIHLAAQSLVSKSYEDPIGTFRTNCLGTISVLESAFLVDSPILVVTSDKVYLPQEGRLRGHLEDDVLGGNDPYSLSKSLADQIALTYSLSTRATTGITVGRAGNVYGGGDHNSGRLFVDIASHLQNGQPLILRQPRAVRPWQHVLDCVYGYIRLMELQTASQVTGAFNFGPSEPEDATVADVISLASEVAGRPIEFEVSSDSFPETHELRIDSTKARSMLGWEPRIPLEGGISLTLEFLGTDLDVGGILTRQVSSYLEIVR